MKTVITALTVVGALALGGCGYTQADRATSGAGIGAVAGGLGTAAAGGNPVAGAVAGGAVGAIAGAATRADQINLGKPIWR